MRATITGLLGELKSFDETLQELIDAYKTTPKLTNLSVPVTTGASQEEYLITTGDPSGKLGVDYYSFPIYTTAVESTSTTDDY